MYFKTAKNLKRNEELCFVIAEVNTNCCWQSFYRKPPGSFAVLVSQDKSH